VRFNIKKRCKKCRLEKCLKAGKNKKIFSIDFYETFFLLGMRKEWILSDKE
jgi:hypothetical protein